MSIEGTGTAVGEVVWDAIVNKNAPRFKALILHYRQFEDLTRLLTTASKDSLLHVVAQNGQTAFVEILCELVPALLNQVNLLGETALMKACELHNSGHDVAAVLLKNKADVRCSTIYNENCLHYFFRAGFQRNTNRCVNELTTLELIEDANPDAFPVLMQQQSLKGYQSGRSEAVNLTPLHLFFRTKNALEGEYNPSKQQYTITDCHSQLFDIIQMIWTKCQSSIFLFRDNKFNTPLEYLAEVVRGKGVRVESSYTRFAENIGMPSFQGPQGLSTLTNPNYASIKKCVTLFMTIRQSLSFHPKPENVATTVMRHSIQVLTQFNTTTIAKPPAAQIQSSPFLPESRNSLQFRDFQPNATPFQTPQTPAAAAAPPLAAPPLAPGGSIRSRAHSKPAELARSDSRQSQGMSSTPPGPPAHFSFTNASPRAASGSEARPPSVGGSSRTGVPTTFNPYAYGGSAKGSSAGSGAPTSFNPHSHGGLASPMASPRRSETSSASSRYEKYSSASRVGIDKSEAEMYLSNCEDLAFVIDMSKIEAIANKYHDGSLALLLFNASCQFHRRKFYLGGSPSGMLTREAFIKVVTKMNDFINADISSCTQKRYLPIRRGLYDAIVITCEDLTRRCSSKDLMKVVHDMQALLPILEKRSNFDFDKAGITAAAYAEVCPDLYSELIALRKERGERNPDTCFGITSGGRLEVVHNTGAKMIEKEGRANILFCTVVQREIARLTALQGTQDAVDYSNEIATLEPYVLE